MFGASNNEVVGLAGAPYVSLARLGLPRLPRGGYTQTRTALKTDREC